MRGPQGIVLAADIALVVALVGARWGRGGGFQEVGEFGGSAPGRLDEVDDWKGGGGCLVWVCVYGCGVGGGWGRVGVVEKGKIGKGV